MFEQTFKNIDDILHKDAGCGSELDYVEQTSCVLFLKYLDDLEKRKYLAPREPDSILDDLDEEDDEEPWLENPVMGAEELLRFFRIRQLLQHN